MDDLTAFVTARINEEEPSDRCGCLDANHVPPCTPQPWKDRKRRELAAKRKLVRRYRTALAIRKEELDMGLAWLYGQLRDEAAIWSDHPDYRAEWAPED